MGAPVTGYDLVIKWNGRGRHTIHLTFYLSLLRPGESDDSIDDSFSDDASSSKPADYVGSRNPVLDVYLLNDLELLEEGLVDPGGIRKQYVVRRENPTMNSKRVPSVLCVIFAIGARTVVVLEKPAGNLDDLTSGAQVATLPFHDRVAAMETVRRSRHARTLSVRLTLFPEVLLALRAPRDWRQTF